MTNDEFQGQPYKKRRLAEADDNHVLHCSSQATLSEIEFCQGETIDEVSTTFSCREVANILSLPDDVLVQVAAFLNVGSLKGARLVCRRFCRVLSLDDAGWTAHCYRLWRRKVHVSEEAIKMLDQKEEDKNNNMALYAYRNSCIDARLRHEILPEELVYDPEAGRTTVWDFRFKQAAGMEWTKYDPWYSGQTARQMVFLPDGTVRQLVQHEVLDIDHPERSETITRLRLPFYDSSDPVGVEITWQFVAQPIDLPPKARGAYIRLTVGGRDVPTYIVHRSPTGNWGFLMENCWGLFASFTLPPRKDVSSHGDSSTTIPMFRKRDLLEDESLPVTSRWQWKEALLYNLGAPRLPDGPGADTDLGQAWQRVAEHLHSLEGFNTFDHSQMRT